MKIHRIQIQNFRNFKNLDVYLGEDAVIVGENRIGKSNFLYALRLVLDPSLPDTARKLHLSDFWDGLGNTLTNGHKIKIAVELTDFENDNDLMAVLGEHLIQPEPMISCLTYMYQPKANLNRLPRAEEDFEFFVYGSDREENRIGYETRNRIPIVILQALRDAENDLLAWSRSPLRPLLDKVANQLDINDLNAIAEGVSNATRAVTDRPEMRQLGDSITSDLRTMVGSAQSFDTNLGFSSTDPKRLIRAIRLFVDGGRRHVGEASLGSANLLYIVLKSMELEQLVEENNRHHTFLGIEEPEAHLHPHLQRRVYRGFLRPREHLDNPDDGETIRRSHQTVLMTTHSPYVASVAPLKSIVLLQRNRTENHTEAVSTAKLSFSPEDVADLERYLDVSRGEFLFARAVILVEGDAEEFLVPVFGKYLGYNFDELGITVASVRGTNFAPFVKLLGPNGLKISFSVLTDFDPQSDGENLGENRVINLVKVLASQEETEGRQDNEILQQASQYGIFLNTHTLEIDLFEAGNHVAMCQALRSVTSNGAAQTRTRGWEQNPGTLDKDRFLKDIKEVGKGRYSQRLASIITGDHIPNYIQRAIEYVVTRCT